MPDTPTPGQAMTRGQFFLALQDAIQVHHEGQWTCHQDGICAPIRLTLGEKAYCPITFVAEACGYDYVIPGAVHHAWMALGLKPRIAHQIQRAADLPEDSATRRLLLACCGLTPSGGHAHA